MLQCTNILKRLISILITASICCNVHAQTAIADMAFIEGGIYTPLYGNDSVPVQVKPFYMDIAPVTNQQFLEFVEQYPKWQRDNTKRLFADEMYLSHWKNNTELGNNAPSNAPVTHVSWFAAKAYCECQQKTLPSIDEWEIVAMAGADKKDARKEENYNQRILDWYEKPSSFPPKEVKSTFKNYWGVYDLNSLIWEWTYDFNSVLISGESRKDGAVDRNLFCSAGAVGATDLMNYAAFLRYAFRGSLKANYNIKNLGFRCVKRIPLKK